MQLYNIEVFEDENIHLCEVHLRSIEDCNNQVLHEWLWSGKHDDVSVLNIHRINPKTFNIIETIF